MRKRSRHVGRFARATTVTIVVVGVVALALAASAASLGGISVGSIFMQSTDVHIDLPDTPTPIVSTDFSGCSNLIDGWIDESGAIWASHSGNWQCLGSGVVRAQQRTPLANLSVEIAQSSGIRISADISDISHQNDRSGAGISLLGDGSGEFFYVIYERDVEQLTIGVAGEAPFAVVTAVGDVAAATMSIEIVGNEMFVEFGSVAIGPFDLTAEAPQLVGNTWFGLVADNDNQSRFDNFTIELLP
ncbi:MAG TPA: hypothetical protein VEB69_06120 [Acidimicrobiia bacterium]|nr:hypothetical protein [Acidimicrobiia bacterium]